MQRRVRMMKSEKGQAAAELAVTLPILLLLLCAIIDFGWVNYCKLSLSYCCREGARLGVVNADASDLASLVSQRVKATAPEYLKDAINVTVTFSNPSSPKDGDITVLVTAAVEGLTPLSGTIFSGSEGITLSTQCVMKME